MEKKFLFDKELINHIYNNLNIILFITDKKGNIIQTNKFTKKFFNKNIINSNIKNYILDFNNSFDIKKYLNNKVHLLHLIKKNVSPQSFNFSFKKINEYILILGQTDYKETIKVQKHIFQLNNELSAKTRALFKKNAELDRLNNLKNMFFGMAAHDIRNPAGIISNFSNMIIEENKHKNLDKDSLEWLNIIQDSAMQILNIINNFLNLSLIEKNKIELNLESTDIIELYNEILSAMDFKFKLKNLVLQTNFQKNLPLIEIDKTKITQVFENIILNAVKYTDYNTVIKINVYKTKNNIITEIQDSGPGISKDETDKLFKIFSKTSNKPKGKFTSSGLGLSICKTLIDAHNGKINVKQENKKGSIFYYALPIKFNKENKNE